MTHDHNLARIKALRNSTFDFAGTEALGYLADHWFEVLNHIEDVLTRHSPVTWEGPLGKQESGCEYCNYRDYRPESYWPWPCQDYISALTLLDALDGGRVIVDATHDMRIDDPLDVRPARYDNIGDGER